MLRSDELLGKAFKEGLSKRERQELLEAYKHETNEKEKVAYQIKEGAGKISERNMIDLPRHRMYGKCPSFLECPIDYKCINYNPSIIKCMQCELHNTDDICRKKNIHNENNFSLIIAREKIDLDKKLLNKR